LVLIIESEWDLISPKQNTFLVENNSTCYMTQEFTTLEHCSPCTEFEIKLAKSQREGVCFHTHNKEILRCKSGEIVIKSCDKIAWLEERNYFIFIVFAFLICAFSTTIIYTRQKILDRNFFKSVSG
jgi:Jumping translocation breakpoint protein (JTB)